MSSPFDGREVFLQPTPPPASTPPAYAQGVVEAWDAVAGTNRIRVRGKPLNNLLSLVGSEGGLIRPGDVVVLLWWQDTAAVLGRIDAPGVEQRALGITSARIADGISVTSSSWTDFGGPEVTVHIGSSRRCRVDLSAFGGGFQAICFMGVEVTGASAIAPAERWSLASGNGGSVASWLGATRSLTLTAADGLNEGPNVFRCKYKLSGGGNNGQWDNREIVVQPF